MVNPKYGLLPLEVYEGISIGDNVCMLVSIDGTVSQIEGTLVQIIGARTPGAEKYHKEYFSVEPEGRTRQMYDCMNIVKIEIRKTEKEPYNTIFSKD